MILAGTPCAHTRGVHADFIESMPMRRLRIRTRCTSVDEFVSRYAVKTDEESIRLPLNRASDGGTRPFAIFLDNDIPVMWGIANLEVADPADARLQFVKLGDEAVVVHEKLLAERFSNEPTACWSKLPLPAPPETRVARRRDVLPDEAPEVLAIARAATQPIRRRPRRPRSRVRFGHGLVIAALAFFGGSWLAADAPRKPSTPSAAAINATADEPTFSPVITPLELPLDASATRVANDDERQTTPRAGRRGGSYDEQP